MSSPRSIRRGLSRWALLAFCCLLPGGALTAQTRSDSAVAAIRKELDELIPLMRRLGQRARSARDRDLEFNRAEVERLVDTFFVGPLGVMALPEQRGLAEEVMRHAADELSPLVDGSEELLAPWTFLVHYHWSGERIPDTGDTLVRRVDVNRRYPRSNLERSAVEVVGNTLLKGLGPEVLEWSGGQPWAAPRRLPWVARELVATPSAAVRRCFRGEMEWCAEAMGLRGAEGGWARWYTPAEQRFYVQERTRPGGARETAIWEGCVLGGQDAACELYLRDTSPLVPFSTEARASLLGHVLWTGGPGAFQRLRGAEGAPILDRLVAAAGSPPEVFLASWRESILSARPSVWASLARSPLAVLFWVLLFGGLAVRSTRWRLG